MRVRHGEGIASHIGPEPCAGVREDIGEASAGDRIGQPLSREIDVILGADAVPLTESNMGERVIASARPAQRGRRPWHVRTLLVREPGDLMSDQGRLAAAGPHREGEEPKPVVYGYEKSDSAIVATKPPNKAGQPAAEAVERRVGTKGNTGQQSTRRTQIRERMSQALDRLRKDARHRLPCASPPSTRGRSRML